MRFLRRLSARLSVCTAPHPYILHRCGAVLCGAVRCGAVRCGAVRCGAVPSDPCWGLDEAGACPGVGQPDLLGLITQHLSNELRLCIVQEWLHKPAAVPPHVQYKHRWGVNYRPGLPLDWFTTDQ